MRPHDTPASRSSVRPALAVAICAMTLGVGAGLGWGLVPLLLPAIARDLEIANATIEWVAWAAPIGLVLASPIGGMVVDRFGPRRVAGLAMLAGALACVARVGATGPGSLVIALFAFGLHAGFVLPAIPKLLGGHVAPQRIARANGVAVVLSTIAAGATVVLAPLLLQRGATWRAVTLVAAAAIGLAGVVWLVAARDGGGPSPPGPPPDSSSSPVTREWSSCPRCRHTAAGKSPCGMMERSRSLLDA